MPFFGRYNLSSPSLRQTFQTYDNAGRELTRIQQSLLDALYRAIPSISNPVDRSALLQAKRDIYKKRPIHADSLGFVAAPIAQMLSAYDCALAERSASLSGNRDRIVSEIKSALERLTEEPEFAMAVDYSCPWLLRRHQRTKHDHRQDFSEQERSLYSYASKFFTKANPFHTFAAIMPPGANSSESALSEVIINLSIVMSLEEECLRRSSVCDRRRLYLRSYFEDANALSFVVPELKRVRVIRLQRDAIAGILLSYFQGAGNTATAAHFLEYFQEQAPQEGQAFAETLLSRLILAGVVAEYFVTDFRHFGKDLAGLVPELDEKIAVLDRHHLCATRPERLISAHRELQLCELPRAEAEPDLYFVNNYCTVNLEPYLGSIGKVSQQLRSLAPLLRLKSNFSANAEVLRRYLTSRLDAAPGRRLPLLKVATDFLRTFDENVSRFQPAARTDAAKLDCDFAELSLLQGTISDSDLLHLVNRFAPGRTDASGLCLNGPFDFVRDIFYLTNVFAGHGRIFARYFLRRQSLPHPYPQKQNVEDTLHVQIATPVHQNRNFVAPMLMAGCGLEARYSHLFQRWIDLSDVVLEISSEGIGYRHRKSGVRLVFHFFGAILADYLIAPYQLLLLEHADFYDNPFEWPSSFSGLLSPGPVQHFPGLHYRDVCLRREQWLLPASDVHNIVAQPDSLMATAELRDLVHRLTGAASEHWFYRLLKENKREKPRFLDLCNPLSLLTLRKTLRSHPPHSILSLTEMRPGPESGMFSDSEEPVSTEVMIEI